MNRQTENMITSHLDALSELIALGACTMPHDRTTTHETRRQEIDHLSAMIVDATATLPDHIPSDPASPFETGPFVNLIQELTKDLLRLQSLVAVDWYTLTGKEIGRAFPQEDPDDAA